MLFLYNGIATKRQLERFPWGFLLYIMSVVVVPLGHPSHDMMNELAVDHAV